MKTELSFKVNEQGNIPKEAVGVIKDFFNSRRGRNIKLTLEDKKKLKSHEQLGYWFSVVVPIFSNFTGYKIDEIHTILKYRAKFIEEIEIDGKPVTKIKSLADATTTDMMAIVDETKKWAEFLNLTIPEPDPFWKT